MARQEIRKIFLLLAVGLIFSAPLRADSLDKLSQDLGSRLKTAGIKKIAVFPFPYIEEKESPGPEIVRERMMKILAKNYALQVSSKSEVDPIWMGKKGGKSKIDPQFAREAGKALQTDAVILGYLSDRKNKVEITASALRSDTGIFIAGGNITLAKSWKEPAANCGSLKYVAVSSAAYKKIESPAQVQVVFAKPWWPAQVIGKITWDFCRPNAQNPTVNDALNDLKKKVWEMGGRGIYIKKNDPHPANPRILQIEAEVLAY